MSLGMPLADACIFFCVITTAVGLVDAKMRVLLAEDDKEVARDIWSALREQGVTVDMFHSGDGALGAAKTVRAEQTNEGTLLPISSPMEIAPLAGTTSSPPPPRASR